MNNKEIIAMIFLLLFGFALVRAQSGTQPDSMIVENTPSQVQPMKTYEQYGEWSNGSRNI